MDEAQPQTTHVRPMWLGKVLIGLLVCVGFAIWSAYDAFSLYPAKQRTYIDHTELQYLDAFSSPGAPPLTAGNASISDPAQTYSDLSSKQRDRQPLSTLEQARLEWLDAISILHSLDQLTAENQQAPALNTSSTDLKRTLTLYNKPRSRLDELTRALQGRGKPTGLAAYDIPLQYVFLVVSTGLSLWLLYLLARVVPRKYRFDYETLTLTTPDADTITPDRIVDVDRRKWDKFLLFIRLEGEQQERRFDLYRYVPLEDWLLAMEKASPNVEAPPEEPEEEAAQSVVDEQQHDEPQRSATG